MLERHTAAALLKVSMQVKALEQYVAALPGASEVDLSIVKAALDAEFNSAYGDIVKAETVKAWADVAAKRVHSISIGENPPEFR